MFTLHPQLERDTIFIADLPLSRALLMNNHLFPWVILVPREPQIQEIMQLAVSQQHQLMDEITAVSQAMQAIFSPDKLNIAALGNQVPQLHIHIIARFKNDTAWPNPVWGKGVELYGDAAPTVMRLKKALAADFHGGAA